NVQVQRVDHTNGILEILGFDGFAGTEIFQIMHYQPSRDRVEEAVLPSWVSHWTAYKKFEQPKEISLEEAMVQQKVLPEDEEDTYCPELESETAPDDDYDTHDIQIQGARIHNLKSVSMSIPKEKITLITGVCGSGKSSLAFDTIFAESQRQFMDLVMSNQMLADTFAHSRVDRISGLQPSIAIAQRSLGANPRSTVGSVTHIADVFKLLFSALGNRFCPCCQSPVDESNVCAQCGEILFDRTPQMFSYNHPDYMCPVCKGLGEELQIDKDLIVEHRNKSLLDSASSLYGDLRKHRKKPNANWMRGEILALADDMKVDLDQPFDRLPEDFKNQFFYGSEGREVSLSYENSKGRSGVITRPVEGAVNLIHRLVNDTKSTRGLENAKRFMSRKTCSRCHGERLLEVGRMVSILGYRYPEIMNMTIDKLTSRCHSIYSHMSEEERKKGKSMLVKILYRLKRVECVGLSYITLDRSIPSLSGGEAQRLKLATQFGTGLSDILYIMDEPSRGLHPRDYRFLMDSLVDLKKYGNTVILVEHKKSFLSIADKHIQMGPKAGRYGGKVVLQHEGTEIGNDLISEDIQEDFDALKVVEPEGRLNEENSAIHIKGASTNNLKNIDVILPKGEMTALIGVSGSGKSSLIAKTLYPHMLKSLGKSTDMKGDFSGISGIESFIDVNYVNQKPIGSNSRSNPGTYTGVFDLIRKCYANTPGAAAQKMGKEHFSFNSKKGQCPQCAGLGEVAVNMHYMEDIAIPCNACRGKRYNRKVLEIKRNDYSIGDILEMEISQLLKLFKEVEEIFLMLSMLEKVGLGYLKLGQSASSLSGGEAQRIKLAKELYRSDCANVLYILDEPTTGLHSEDVDKVTRVLQELKDKGASLIIIEHNLRLIQECDYIVELGPGGGDQGGNVLRMGYRQK
ncbi:MAG: excinuclease ABC subunit UvrA, partial [Spirochaetaceae bacterium]|nr:excinuclease ABC subunit UvrA [Spirochaetaceae bacterium]